MRCNDYRIKGKERQYWCCRAVVNEPLHYEWKVITHLVAEKKTFFWDASHIQQTSPAWHAPRLINMQPSDNSLLIWNNEGEAPMLDDSIVAKGIFLVVAAQNPIFSYITTKLVCFSWAKFATAAAPTIASKNLDTRYKGLATIQFQLLMFNFCCCCCCLSRT